MSYKPLTQESVELIARHLIDNIWVATDEERYKAATLALKSYAAEQGEVVNKTMEDKISKLEKRINSREVQIMNNSEVMQDLLEEDEDHEDEINSRDAEIWALESRLCVAKEALEGLEYVQGSLEGEPRYCPWCELYEPGHKEDCQRQQALTHTGPCKHEAKIKQTWALAHEESRCFLERAEKAEVEIEKLKSENMCDVCAGTGTGSNVPARPCICSGTGLASRALLGMREEFLKVNSSVAGREAQLTAEVEANDKIHAELKEERADNGSLRNEVGEWKGNYQVALDNWYKYLKANESLRRVLGAIAEGRGRFDLDQVQHCKNTVEDMKKLATDALVDLHTKEGE